MTPRRTIGAMRAQGKLRLRNSRARTGSNLRQTGGQWPPRRGSKLDPTPLANEAVSAHAGDVLNVFVDCGLRLPVPSPSRVVAAIDCFALQRVLHVGFGAAKCRDDLLQGFRRHASLHGPHGPGNYLRLEPAIFELSLDGSERRRLLEYVFPVRCAKIAEAELDGATPDAVVSDIIRTVEVPR